MSITPDIAGFVAASKLLRQQTGDTVVFSIPQTPTWPVGTRINPDTNEPFDAMVQPTNVPVQVSLKVSVILKEASPLRPQADTHFSEAGLLSGMDIILDVDGDDYSQVQNATEFNYAGKNYHVEEAKPFAMNDVTYRWLIYGQEH